MGLTSRILTIQQLFPSKEFTGMFLVTRLHLLTYLYLGSEATCPPRTRELQKQELVNDKYLCDQERGDLQPGVGVGVSHVPPLSTLQLHLA